MHACLNLRIAIGTCMDHTMWTRPSRRQGAVSDGSGMTASPHSDILALISAEEQQI